MAALVFAIEEKVKKEQEQADNKHKYKVNRTNALSMIKEMLANVVINKTIRPTWEAFAKVLHATKEIIKPGGKNDRKILRKSPFYELQTSVVLYYLNLTHLLPAVSFQLSGGSESYIDLLIADT